MIDDLASKIKNCYPATDMPIVLVAIDGHGGSGKTTLATKLANALNAEILHTDDFSSYDKPLDWWTRIVDEVFEPIRLAAQTLSYERGSWHKTHKPSPVLEQIISPIMILEGVSSSRTEFRKYLGFSIWVETPLDVCLKRGIERDLKDNSAGKTIQQLEADWNKWHNYEKEYVERDNPRANADYIVNGTLQLV